MVRFKISGLSLPPNMVNFIKTLVWITIIGVVASIIYSIVEMFSHDRALRVFEGYKVFVIVGNEVYYGKLKVPPRSGGGFELLIPIEYVKEPKQILAYILENYYDTGDEKYLREVLRLIDEFNLRGGEFVFKDRLDAGKRLGEKLQQVLGKILDGWVLAIPAGGVPVAYMVSKILGLPLDVAVVRKIQIPWNTEAGFGALAWDGTLNLNHEILAGLGLTKKQVDESIAKTRKILEVRMEKLRGRKPFPNLEGKTVILVDDGLATGYTMLTAVEAVAKHQPEKIVVAIPTGSMDAVELLVDNPNISLIICLNIRGGPIFAVADAYQQWYDLTDEETKKYLAGS